MENKFNIEEVNAWLKEEYGMSYDELSKEFNKAVDLLSESLKQRKEMRDKINKAIEFIENQILEGQEDWIRKNIDIAEVPGSDLPADCIVELLDILKEDK